MDQYWSANVNYGAIDLGRPLSYEMALKEVIAGKSVFTVTRIQAEALALAAGGGVNPPMYNDPHFPSIGYYPHFHVYNHENAAHIWFLR